MIVLAEVDINFRDNKGYGALIYMANNSDFSFLLAKAISRSDADVNIQTNEGFTPLMVAANRSNFTTLEHLLKHKELKLEIKDNQGRDVYFFANKARFKKEVLNWIEKSIQNN